MPRGLLGQLVGRGAGTSALLTSLSAALGGSLAVEDAEGRLLHGEAVAEGPRVPVSDNGVSLGWVSGRQAAQPVAALLELLVARERERKALGSEVLHLYREINLIYTFSEKLAALLDLERVAALTLQQARQLIVATDGAVLLADEGGALVPVALAGDAFPTAGVLRRGTGIVGAVAASGVGEIVNDVDEDPRRVVDRTGIKALIAAPLTVGERVIGVLALASTVPMAYTAAELKLLTTLASQAATAIENARLFERTVQAAAEREKLQALHQQAELARTRLESEMNLAARIQQDLFPARLPGADGYLTAARNRPARRCGGDYYDALEVAGAGDGSLLYCVADVAGKGLPAALVMSNMQATLRALLGRTASLPELALQASALLFAATPPERYVTAALVRMTPENGEVRFVGAGHLDNYVLRRDGSLTRLASTGMPLGLLENGLPYEETRERLDEGDSVVLFSDGVTDAQNDAGEEFGEARLHDVLRASAGLAPTAVIDRTFAALDAFTGQAPQFDDITMLVVSRTAASRTLSGRAG